ncbi:TolC family protein [Pedobacter montanisoli]|uniref:TolC family protein n=1 Tax=Pedobacter montanisoli TaxID=2923277 RepID=A0ABS9ZUN3_9SPHI|nr:TolC family protein [Pedobacter montanisoli]MCJ0742305.1 TolC family protein [Pedobacter montanisoli]
MKKNKKFIYLAQLCLLTGMPLFGFIGQSKAQEVITIQQAIDSTLKNNLQIKQAQFNYALSDENLKQSKNALLPTLNASSGFNKNFGRSIDPSTNQYISQQFNSLNGNLSAGVDLFSGWQKLNQIKQNKLLLDVDKTNVDKIKNDLILQVVTAYMQVLYNKDLLKVAKDQLGVAKQQLNQQQQLLEVGNKTLADISQAKSQVATSELNVTNAENNLNISFLSLTQLMEKPASYTFEVQAPLVDQLSVLNAYSATEVYNTAAGNFPDVKLASFRTLAAAKAIDVAKGSYFPRLSMGGGLGSNYSSSFTSQSFSSQIKDNFGQYVGLSLSVPIFNGFNARSSVRKARISYENTRIQEQLTKNNLSKVIHQAVADLKAAESRYTSTKNAFDAQKDAFYVIDQRYQVGLVNSLDYSTALTNKNKAEIDMIQAKYDLLFKAKVIDYYLGKQIVF